MIKNQAVFLDRDGTIIQQVEYLYRIKDLEVLPRAANAIKLLNKFKIPAIVITNQPVVAKGLLTEKGVIKIHQKLQKILNGFGAGVDEFYFCPHHPEGGLEKYRKKCGCRKPGVGLFRKAAKKFNIIANDSFMIGDSFRDIEAGKNFGCKTIGVRCGVSDFQNSNPDFMTDDLYTAVRLILRNGGLV